MASIERTAYPRFKSSLTTNELQALYCPTDEELEFIATHARGDTQQLALLTLLKCQQHLGYLPALTEVPEQIRTYLCQQLHLLPLMYTHVEAEKTLYRYRQMIRTFLEIKPYGDGGQDVVEPAVQQAAYTMSDPADLINLAVEHLIEQRFELPAFSTLDRLVMHIRHGVHQDLYARITALLGASEMECLDTLLQVRDGRTDFNRIKDTPRQATLKHLRQWTERLTWLESILPTPPFLTEVTNTKVQQFAAEAAALDVGDMRDINTPSRRYSLLICFLYQAQVQTRDELVGMLLKRMLPRSMVSEGFTALISRHGASHATRLELLTSVGLAPTGFMCPSLDTPTAHLIAYWVTMALALASRRLVTMILTRFGPKFRRFLESTIVTSPS